MKHRAHRPVSRQKPRNSVRGSYTLVLIDGGPVRNRARKNYQHTLSDLKKVEAEISSHEEIDESAFRQWLHQHFGPQLTELRELHTLCMPKEQLLNEIEGCVIFEGLSWARAYDAVQKRRRGAQADQASANAQESFDFNQKGDRSPDPDEEDKVFEEFYNSMSDLFEENLGFRPPPLTDDHEASPIQNDSRRPRSQGGDRLRECYRAIVRRLHPDHHGTLSKAKEELWHQAQEAYKQQDHSALEIILARCESEEQGIDGQDCVSLMRKMTQTLKDQLKAIREKLRLLKKQPSWRFTKLEDRNPLGRRVEAELEGELKIVRRDLVELTSRLDQLEAQSRRSQKRKTASSQTKRRSTKTPSRSNSSDIPF